MTTTTSKPKRAGDTNVAGLSSTTDSSDKQTWRRGAPICDR